TTKGPVIYYGPSPSRPSGRAHWPAMPHRWPRGAVDPRGGRGAYGRGAVAARARTRSFRERTTRAAPPWGRGRGRRDESGPGRASIPSILLSGELHSPPARRPRTPAHAR